MNTLTQQDLRMRRLARRSVMMPCRESQRESVWLRSHITTKKLLKTGTWNVRTLYEAGRTLQVVREMKNFNTGTKWNQVATIRTEEAIFWGGYPLLWAWGGQCPPYRGRSLWSFKRSTASSYWLRTSKFQQNSSDFQHQKQEHQAECGTVLQYAPTNAADDGKKEELYEQLQNLLNKLKPKDITILMGDFNAKIGADNIGYEDKDWVKWTRMESCLRTSVLWINWWLEVVCSPTSVFIKPLRIK